MDALAGAVGVAKSVVHDWERGVMTPKPPNLAGLAEALEVDLERLYVLAGYRVPRVLPALGEYLRASYPDLPSRAIKRMERAIAEVANEAGARAAKPS